MTTRECPECGGSLPPEAPAGACPRCLLAVGLEPGEDAGDSEADGPEGEDVGKPARTAPSIEEMAAHFPLLDIEGVIGHGGMGIVYRARQKALDRPVALKVLWPELGADKAFADRFTREARALARLDHPHIVRVYEFGERDGFYYLLMEYVAGANLRTLMNAGEIHPQQALAIVPQMCEALQYAHDQGVVHRDIKPANVLVDVGGRVKIADFGLAKLVEGGDDLTLTRAGQVMGTLHYMAPEQYQTPGDVDHRADIYSLGVVFYEMLTGDVPMGRFDPPSKKVQLDVRLDAVVLRALDKERDRRYQRAGDVGTEVSSISSTEVPAGAAGAAAPDAPQKVEKTYTWDSGNRRPDARLSRLAVTSAACVVLSVLLLATGFGLIPIWTAGAASAVAALVAGLTGLIAWIRIGSSDGYLYGVPYAAFATFAPLALGCCGFFTWPFLLAGGLASQGEFEIGDERVHIGPIMIDEDSVDVGPIHVDENGTVVGPIAVDERGVRIGGETPRAMIDNAMITGGPEWMDAEDLLEELRSFRTQFDILTRRWKLGHDPGMPFPDDNFRYGNDWERVQAFFRDNDDATTEEAMRAGSLGLPLLIFPPAGPPLKKYKLSRVWLARDGRAATVEAVVRGHRLEWTMHVHDGNYGWCYDFAPVKRERSAEER